ncbi:mannitol-1-phosphate 5-dehydrogenase [Paenibacillus sp. BR2-3]|uniref:mannitol-1-phosphate 5-dehydrogenase n=1 Tax=Paenibacillus sp. BR2-3 TaxID=3048494 RepID=UPI003977923B
MKALHFGAGNIGKGFIGNLLSKTGYEVCFVDVNPDLIHSINKSNSYSVEILDNRHSMETISSVSALNSVTQEEKVIEAIINADLITTSVGVGNLSKIAKILSVGLLKRVKKNPTNLDIIANENAINASLILKEAIGQLVSNEEMEKINSFVGFPNSAIDRLALSKKSDEGEVALVEPFFEWVINKAEMVNPELPLIPYATYVEDLKPYIERKLYIVNMGHACTAYLAFIAGEPTIQSALSVPEIEHYARNAMAEASRYILQTYSSDSQEMEQFIDKTIERFKNPHISDDILRVGRSPIRKLGYDERLVKPTRELFRLGLPIDHLTVAIAAAFIFDHPEDEESVLLQKYILENGIERAISHFSHMENSEIKDRIAKNYDSLKNSSKLTK